MDKEELLKNIEEMLDMALYSCDTEQIDKFNKTVIEIEKIINEIK